MSIAPIGRACPGGGAGRSRARRARPVASRAAGAAGGPESAPLVARHRVPRGPPRGAPDRRDLSPPLKISDRASSAVHERDAAGPRRSRGPPPAARALPLCDHQRPRHRGAAARAALRAPGRPRDADVPRPRWARAPVQCPDALDVVERLLPPRSPTVCSRGAAAIAARPALSPPDVLKRAEVEDAVALVVGVPEQRRFRGSRRSRAGWGAGRAGGCSACRRAS